MKKDEYGRVIYTLDQEIALPECVKETRRNKERIYSACTHGMKLLEQLRRKAYQIPEEDNLTHAELVAELASKAQATLVSISDTVFFEGRRY